MAQRFNPAKWIELLAKLYADYCNRPYLQPYIDQAGYDQDELALILERVYKRNEYYRRFHDMPQGLSEVKIKALIVFWILKYRPLRVDFRARTESELEGLEDKKLYDDSYTYFTEQFCIHIADCTSWELRGEGLWVSSKYLEELRYNMRNADISKEAMIAIFELLIPCY